MTHNDIDALLASAIAWRRIALAHRSAGGEVGESLAEIAELESAVLVDRAASALRAQRAEVAR